MASDSITRRDLFGRAGTWLAVGGTLSGSLAMAGPTKAYAKNRTVLRLGSPTAMSDPINKVFATRFAHLVAEKSGGELEVKLFPNEQLGTEQGMISDVQLGSLDFSLNTTAFLETVVRDIQVLDLPFIFPNLAGVEKVVGGPIGRSLAHETLAKGMVTLSWPVNGWRSMENNVHPLVEPGDVKGLRMRIQPGPTYVALFKALGATPVTIDFGELYTSLARHVVDGCDVSIFAVVSAKIYEVAKYLSMTNHVPNFYGFVASAKRMNSLGPSLRKVIFEAAHDATNHHRARLAEYQANTLHLLAKSMKEALKVDHSAFAKKMTPVYGQFAKKLRPHLVEDVIKAAGTYA